MQSETSKRPRLDEAALALAPILSMFRRNECLIKAVEEIVASNSLRAICRELSRFRRRSFGVVLH